MGGAGRDGWIRRARLRTATATAAATAAGDSLCYPLLRHGLQHLGRHHRAAADVRQHRARMLQLHVQDLNLLQVAQVLAINLQRGALRCVSDHATLTWQRDERGTPLQTVEVGGLDQNGRDISEQLPGDGSCAVKK